MTKEQLLYLADLALKGYDELTQKDRVLKYINQFGSITQLEAIWDIGIMRLGARIHELIKEGWPIISDSETGMNRFGQMTRYARYRQAA